MMSDFHAKADPDYGHVHRLNIRLLDSDNGLAVFIMQEILKEDKSFYRPYLRVLPSPYNLRSWSGEDLLLLQDHKLVRRVAARRRQLRALYHDTIEYLSNAYPELYSADRYTFELFDFAWSTLQARAFGKRLKSSALVPFADCLNHGNVQTKRAEVLNSYGRRANDNLLLDYGFAMLDNEILRVRRDVWSTELMRFCRCACLTAPELDNLEAAVNQQAATPQGSSPADTAYREARLAQDSPPELLHALIYRVTIKRILARQLGMAEEAVARVQALVRERSESFVNNGGKDEQRSTLHAPPSSSRLDDLLSLPPHQKTTTPCGGGSQYHHHSESSGSTSFASYLLDVERALLSRGQQKQQGSPSP
eukprot:g1752.t1